MSVLVLRFGRLACFIQGKPQVVVPVAEAGIKTQDLVELRDRLRDAPFIQQVTAKIVMRHPGVGIARKRISPEGLFIDEQTRQEVAFPSQKREDDRQASKEIGAKPSASPRFKIPQAGNNQANQTNNWNIE